jgi:hypothetical protein
MKRVYLLTALYIGGATLIMPLRVRGLSAAFNAVTRLTESRGEQYFVIASFVFLFLLAMTAECLWGATKPRAATAFFLLLVAAGGCETFGCRRCQTFNGAVTYRDWRRGAELTKPVHPAWDFRCQRIQMDGPFTCPRRSPASRFPDSRITFRYG